MFLPAGDSEISYYANFRQITLDFVIEAHQPRLPNSSQLPLTIINKSSIGRCWIYVNTATAQLFFQWYIVLSNVKKVSPSNVLKVILLTIFQL